jgi:anaerobic magnesium-protoporphyrin IX monomethyl ester cyclase
MKIVFVQPNVGFKGHTWEALGIGYLISYLKKNYTGKLDVEFYSGFYDSDEQIISACKNADIIGFGCTSPQYKHALNLARQIKTPKNHITFGGIHPTVLPELVLKEECVDSVAAGEGEKAILQLVKDLADGRNIRKKRYETDYITNLDDIPFPDRTAIKNERNIMQAFRDEGTRITSMLASRGCPFRCSFCCSRNVWSSETRFRSTNNLLDEMEVLVKDWNVEFLKFSDDTFTVNKQRVIDFCIKKMERKITLPYGANAHINTIDEDLLQYLEKSGCQELWYGVESGSPRILKEMHKSTNIPKIKEVFKLTKEHGIKTRAYFLLGIPSETIEDIEMTEKLCDEIQPDMVGFTLLAPFPTNEYFDYKKMVNWDWSTFDEYSNDWVSTKTISNKELKSIQKRLVEKYQKVATFRQRQQK